MKKSHQQAIVPNVQPLLDRRSTYNIRSDNIGVFGPHVITMELS